MHTFPARTASPPAPVPRWPRFCRALAWLALGALALGAANATTVPSQPCLLLQLAAADAEKKEPQYRVSDNESECREAAANVLYTIDRQEMYRTGEPVRQPKKPPDQVVSNEQNWRFDVQLAILAISRMAAEKSATPALKQAFAKLNDGDVVPAVAWLAQAAQDAAKQNEQAANFLQQQASLLRLHDFPQAYGVLEQALALKPDDLSLLWHACDWAQDLRRYAQGFALVKRVRSLTQLQLEKGDAQAAPHLLATYAYEAYLHYLQGNYVAAVSSYQTLREKQLAALQGAQKGSLDIERNLSDTHRYLGLSFKKLGNLAAAQQQFEQGIAVRTNGAPNKEATAHYILAQLHENLAQVQVAQKQGVPALQSYQRAIKIYQEILQQNPFDTQVQVALALASGEAALAKGNGLVKAEKAKLLQTAILVLQNLQYLMLLDEQQSITVKRYRKELAALK